ncbi:MAG: WXG100 family type VII secretion target [Gemmataceae bacterium]|nr:WXG100 family type VII secretion target [Gemmataceae bacterium]
MAQAIVDPVELRRFAHHLKQFNGELRERIAALHGQLLALGDTWRDQEHEKFVREFEQTMAVLEAFLENADQHVPMLLRKAERIEEYLHR